MPKIIDHEKRKIQIAEATWKVIAEEGIDQATVRKIAKSAGLSVGSLRHYFSSQSELLSFSMQLVSDRVKQRTEAKQYEGTPLEILKEIIGEVLPLDDERRIEMEVWFAFSARMLVDEKLKALGENVYEEMQAGMRRIIESLHTFGLAKDHLDSELEAMRLHALVDGLALHHLMHKEKFPRDQLIKTVEYHISSLCKEAGT